MSNPEENLSELLAERCFTRTLAGMADHDKACDQFKAMADAVDDCLTEIINSPTRGLALAAAARIRRHLHLVDEENRK